MKGLTLAYSPTRSTMTAQINIGDRNDRDHVLRLASVQMAFVPNALTTNGRHWLPREPLLGWQDHQPAPDGTYAIENCAFDSELSDRVRKAIAAVDAARQTSLGLKLKQILGSPQPTMLTLPFCPSVSYQPI